MPITGELEKLEQALLEVKIHEAVIFFIFFLVILVSCRTRKNYSLIDPSKVKLTIEIVSGNDIPVLSKGNAGTEDNKYGFGGERLSG